MYGHGHAYTHTYTYMYIYNGYSCILQGRIQDFGKGGGEGGGGVQVTVKY